MKKALCFFFEDDHVGAGVVAKGKFPDDWRLLKGDASSRRWDNILKSRCNISYQGLDGHGGVVALEVDVERGGGRGILVGSHGRNEGLCGCGGCDFVDFLYSELLEIATRMVNFVLDEQSNEISSQQTN